MAPINSAPPLGISMGDPAGIGAEVILKSAAALARGRNVPKLVVLGDIELMKATARRLDGVPEPVSWNNGKPLPGLSRALSVLELSRLPKRATVPGRPTVEGGDAAYKYIETGARMALRGELGGLVTAPISKEWLNRAGHRFPGHSELLASLARVRLWRMMFAGGSLRLALVTVHIGLGKVSRHLTRRGIFDTIRLMAEHLRGPLHIKHPRIRVLAFNPHAGENGLFGDEEIRIIQPAVTSARRAGIDAHGPVAPDTAFVHFSGSFDFDGIVAMYHDQGLIPLKTLEFDRAVNITLGLPFIRTSPDHGTAFDIAASGTARAASMTAAIEYAWRVASASAAQERRGA